MAQSITLKLDDERADWLRSEAEAQGVDVSTIVAHLIDAATTTELSDEASDVLDILKALKARPGTVMEARVIADRWKEEGRDADELSAGLHELVELELLEQHGSTGFSLTEEGYEVLSD